MKHFQLWFFLILTLVACNEAPSDNSSDSSLQIRLDKDPQRINPFFAPTSIGREIFQYIYLPVADYDPQSLKLSPILIKDVPIGKMVMHQGDSLLAFKMTILEDAVWSDGAPITAKDYLFTVKSIMHPNSEIRAWKPYFENLVDIVLSPGDPKSFTVFMNPNYFLARETCLTTCLMPAHVFDPNESFEKISIPDKSYTTEDSLELQVIADLNTSMNDKRNVVQSGPYQVQDFQTDEYYLLKKLDNYWGQKYPDRAPLQGKITNLTFRIIPDDITALTLAKENKIDFLSLSNSQKFVELKNDPNINKNWRFDLPQIMQYYFVSMNNTSTILSDKKVRRAIAHLIDVEDMIENLDQGFGQRTVGPFHPTKYYYNESLKPIPYKPETAIKLLDEAGWTDTDNDGIRDKMINQEKINLSLDFLITGSPLSQGLALLTKESAEKVGVSINIISKKMSLIRRENYATYNYDLAASAVTLDAAPDDPYTRWHSDNVKPGGTNISGFKNKRADKLIEKIRSNKNPEDLKSAYLELQEIIYEEQPVVFLYAPFKKFLLKKDLNALTTSKRPGYLANTFSWKE